MNNEVGAASVAPAERGRNTAQVFEQQTKESAEAVAAFKTYLELGPDRSLALNVKETDRAGKEVGGVGISTN